MAISNDTATPTSTAGSGRILIVVCFAFFATGLSQATIGPAIPDLARHTHSGVVAVGSSLTAFYLCALGALSASSFLIDRIGRVRILFVGMVACIVGSAGLALSPTLPLLIMSAGCMGLGVGSVNLIGNVLAAEASSGAGPINLVNAMFGIGSIVSPALIGASMTYLSTGIPAIWSAPCAMIVAACLLVFWVPKQMESRRQLGHQVLPERSSPSAVFRSPLAWTIVVLTIMYSVVDAGLSGWLPHAAPSRGGTPARIRRDDCVLVLVPDDRKPIHSCLGEPIRPARSTSPGLCWALHRRRRAPDRLCPNEEPDPGICSRYGVRAWGWARLSHCNSNDAIVVPASHGDRNRPRARRQQHRRCVHAVGAWCLDRKYRCPGWDRDVDGRHIDDGAHAHDHRVFDAEGASFGASASRRKTLSPHRARGGSLSTLPASFCSKKTKHNLAISLRQAKDERSSPATCARLRSPSHSRPVHSGSCRFPALSASWSRSILRVRLPSRAGLILRSISMSAIESPRVGPSMSSGSRLAMFAVMNA